MKYEREANLSTESCSDVSELKDNSRICSQCKKLLEITRSCQKVAEQLVESPSSIQGLSHQMPAIATFVLLSLPL